MSVIPLNKRPIIGSEGDLYRIQQLERQMPLHDIDVDSCSSLETPEERAAFEAFCARKVRPHKRACPMIRLIAAGHRLGCDSRRSCRNGPQFTGAVPDPHALCATRVFIRWKRVLRSVGLANSTAGTPATAVVLISTPVTWRSRPTRS